MTIYLYKKTHNITGLKYLGKTESLDPYSYTGSGEYWLDHINIHGYDVKTEILKECQTNDEIKHWGKYYSELWNIVEERDSTGHKTWANLKPEEGDGGALPVEFWQDLYGVDNPSQLESVKQKKKETTKKNYGVDHPLKNEDIKTRRKETYIEIYGVDNPSQLESVKQKKKETTKKNYGVDNPSQSDIVKEKNKKTNLEKRGVENVFQDEKVKSKQRNTLFEKYGVTNPGQLPHVKEKNRQRINGQLLTCPHCGKTGTNLPNMKRHHFDRCKLKQ